MKRVFFLLFFSLSLSKIYSQTTDIQTTSNSALDLSKYEVRKIYSNDFSSSDKIDFEENFISKTSNGYQRKRLPFEDAQWVVEGWGDVRIVGGKMWATSSKFDSQNEPVPMPDSLKSHLLIWNRNIFPENALYEFEVNHCGSTNGLTLVFFNTWGKDGQDIFDLNLPARRANYKLYHSDKLVNYTDSYWSRNAIPAGESLTNRLRHNPNMKIIGTGNSLTHQSANQTYTIRILKYNQHIEIEINHQVVIRSDDAESSLKKGYFGFRSMAGIHKIWYDNFSVSELTLKK